MTFFKKNSNYMTESIVNHLKIVDSTFQYLHKLY